MRNWGYAKARRGPRRRGGLVPLAGVWSLSEIVGVLPYGAVVGLRRPLQKRALATSIRPL